MPERQWRFRLDDILEAAAHIEEDIGGHDALSFMESRQTRQVVERNITVIGEAVRNIPPAVLDGEPGISWRNIVGMRNILVHGYFGLDHDVLWITATVDVPALVAAVHRLRQTDPGGPS